MSSWKNVSSSREPSLVWFMTLKLCLDFLADDHQTSSRADYGHQFPERHQFLVNAGNVWGTNEHIHKCLFILNILWEEFWNIFNCFKEIASLKADGYLLAKAIYFRPNPKKIELKLAWMVIIVITTTHIYQVCLMSCVWGTSFIFIILSTSVY